MIKWLKVKITTNRGWYHPSYNHYHNPMRRHYENFTLLKSVPFQGREEVCYLPPEILEKLEAAGLIELVYKLEE